MVLPLKVVKNHPGESADDDFGFLVGFLAPAERAAVESAAVSAAVEAVGCC
jgi:hypothetical protein